MKKPPILENEKERLKALDRYEIVDTTAEPVFDEITELAAKICGTHQAILSFIEKDRQWFKSTYNVDNKECPRELSMCAHAIAQKGPLIVENTLEDDCFSNHPFVTDDPKIRFYAGIPLVTTDGYQIGNLCVFDNSPQKLEPTQVRSLKLLADNAMQICELRLKNKFLQENRDLMDEFQKTAHIGGWELDLASKQTSWTDEVFDIYGLDNSTNLNEVQAMSYYVEPSQSRLRECLKKCMEDGTPFDDFFELKSESGEIKWLHNHGRLICGENGAPIKLVGTCQDVTDQILQENEIKKQKQFLSDTISNLPAIFYTRSKSGEILMMNEHFKAFHRVNEKIKGSVMAQNVFSSENLPILNKLDISVLELGRVTESEDTLMGENNTKRVFNSFRFPYRDINGDIYAIGCISIDITNKKILESQSLHKAKLASIGEMAAGAGHEINNPLAIIIGYVSKLKKKKQKGELTDDEFNSILESISKSAFRISKIVSGIRSFARYDSEGTMDFDIIESIRESTHMLQEVYDGDGISIEFKTDLPNNKYYVHGNRGQIQQVVINLISNAKDATSKVAEPKIEIECQSCDDTILLTVTDNGSGIPKDIQTRIFDPFFTTKSAENGTGIGLSLVNKLISDHGGSIQLESEQGQGAQFQILLPYKESELQSLDLDTPSIFEDFATVSPKQILVIDDEPEIRELLQESLELLGYNASGAENGRSALKLCQEKPNFFDLILCDIRMPEMDGYQFYKEFKKINSTAKTRFVFITGGVNIELTAPMTNMENKVDGFLYKPFDHKKLIELLDQIFAEPETLEEAS